MKKNFIKITVISMLSLLVSKGLFAQHDHEFSLHGGGGLSTLHYKVTVGDQKFGLGAPFGLGYHLFFSPNWGLGTGVELAFYNARFKVNNLNISYNTFDHDGDPFEFRSTVNHYKEKQHAMLLQIPLMLQFQTNKIDSKRQFFAALGGKAGFPMSINGKDSNKASLFNAGYYEDGHHDTQASMGFGNFYGKKGKGDLNFKTAFFLSAETGFKWMLREKMSLYAGIYVDYGLNNVIKRQSLASLPSFVDYNGANPTAFAVNSIINSQYRQGGAPHAFTEKIRPIAAGIKLRLAFGKSGKPAQTQAQALPAPRPAPVTDINAEAKLLAEEAAARKAAAEEAARRAAEEAARKAAEEATRRSAEEAALKASAEKAALNEAIRQIQIPVDSYVLNQTDPNESQKQNLDEKIALLKKYPNLTFHIQGHTCDIGSNEENERIGSRRDIKAKAYIVSKGIAESRILSSASKGETEPLVPNTSEENRKLNRRVQLLIQ